MGLLPSKVSLSEKPCLIAAASANAFIVEPAWPPATAQLIWESR